MVVVDEMVAPPAMMVMMVVLVVVPDILVGPVDQVTHLQQLLVRVMMVVIPIKVILVVAAVEPEP